LAIPLGAFTFDLSDAAPIGIAFDERITEDPGGWRFHHRWATPVHSLAVATPRSTTSLKVHVHDARGLGLGTGGDTAAIPSAEGLAGHTDGPGAAARDPRESR
ncbi:MAG: hypothetical protein P8R43_05490, partial [Planctomycetota bacterium]|nr:hypothetical protein [Planctomycetota bacterium]